jgi:hypothetical protein
LFVAGWAVGGIYSEFNDTSGAPRGLGFLPVLGAFMQAAFVHDSYDYNGYSSTVRSHDGVRAFYTLDGLAQAGGFVMFLVGLAAGPDKIEKQPVLFGGAAFPGGGGVSASGHF